MATHYSVSDWDLTGGWLLDTGTYVSSPSSMRFSASAGGTCKRSEVWNLSQGMIVTYAKASWDWGGGEANNGPLWGFRNQATSDAGLGSYGLVASGYTVVINIGSNNIWLYRDARSISSVTPISKPAHINAWNKYRVTWWSDTGGAGLFVRLEYWNGTNWVKMVNDWNDTTDKYKTSTVNRVSLGSYYNYYVWFDDTEIWGP